MHRSSRRQAKSPIVQSTRHRRIINCESLSNSSLLASWLLVSCRRLGMSAKCPWNVRTIGLDWYLTHFNSFRGFRQYLPISFQNPLAANSIASDSLTWLMALHKCFACLLTDPRQSIARTVTCLPCHADKSRSWLLRLSVPVWADVGKDHVVLVHIMKGVKNLSEWSHDLLLRLLRQRRMPVDATTTDKLLQYTGSQRPHRCCPLANQVEIENIDCGEVCLVWPPKPPPLVGEIRVPANTQLLAFQSPHGSAFWSWLTDRYIDRPRYNGNNRPHLMLRIATPMGRNNNVNSINNNYSDNSSNEVMQKIIHFE